MKKSTVVWLKWLYWASIFVGVLQLFTVPFSTPVYALLITGLGFTFSPIHIIISLLDKRFNPSDRIFSVLVCLYVGLICGGTVIFRFQDPTTYETLVFPILAILLFVASEYAWRHNNSSSRELLSTMRSFGWWFLPLLAYPMAYRFVVN